MKTRTTPKVLTQEPITSTHRHNTPNRRKGYISGKKKGAGSVLSGNALIRELEREMDRLIERDG